MAQDIDILPPTFTEKNLQTKKVIEEKKLVVGRPKSEKVLEVSKVESKEESHRSSARESTQRDTQQSVTKS